MAKQYKAQCQCGSVQLTITGKPLVHAFCHCEDCRELLDIPYHSVTAWSPDNVVVSDEHGRLKEYQHPELTMKRCFCSQCGEVLFNTNVMDWKVVSQLLIAKSNDGTLPEELASARHFFYEQRVVDVDDHLPKYLRGTDGPLYE